MGSATMVWADIVATIGAVLRIGEVAAHEAARRSEKRSPGVVVARCDRAAVAEPAGRDGAATSPAAVASSTGPAR